MIFQINFAFSFECKETHSSVYTHFTKVDTKSIQKNKANDLSSRIEIVHIGMKQ